jgi:hypothetical protein
VVVQRDTKDTAKARATLLRDPAPLSCRIVRVNEFRQNPFNEGRESVIKPLV